MKSFTQSKLSIVLASALALTACGSDNDSSAPEVVKEVTKNYTDAQIQAKQSADIVKTFASIKTLQGTLSEDSAKTTFDSIKPMVAANAQAKIASWIDGKLANKDKTAAKNVAGKVDRTPKDGAARSVVVDKNAAEYDQLVKKGLIGAYQFKNMLDEVMKVKEGADNAAILANVTAYLLGDYAQLAEGKGEDYYAGNEFEKYLKRVAGNENFSTVEDDLYKQLADAKTNLNDDAKFKESIMQAVATAQKTLAIRTVHYLNAGAQLSNELEAGQFGNLSHDISEGLGMLYSMQYTYNPETKKPYYTEAQVNEFIDGLDLWNTEDAKTKLASKVKEISTTFGFDATKA